jgi:hypothetical protein
MSENVSHINQVFSHCEEYSSVSSPFLPAKFEKTTQGLLYYWRERVKSGKAFLTR